MCHLDKNCQEDARVARLDFLLHAGPSAGVRVVVSPHKRDEPAGGAPAVFSIAGQFAAEEFFLVEQAAHKDGSQ